jgi:hypothetical protein
MNEDIEQELTSAIEEAKELRTVRRYYPATGTSEVVRMIELREGDIFSLQNSDGTFVGSDDPNTETKWIACDDPQLNGYAQLGVPAKPYEETNEDA